MTDVEAFITLETNEIGAERGGRGSGKRRLAHSGLALEEQRPFQAERQKQRNGQTTVRHVMLVGQTLLEVGDGSWKNGDDP